MLREVFDERLNLRRSRHPAWRCQDAFLGHVSNLPAAHSRRYCYSFLAPRSSQPAPRGQILS
jgi:hypothetical protein